MYDDGKGIGVRFSFFPLPDLKAKKRKNSKPVPIVKKLAIHEDYSLNEFLVALLQSVGRDDLLGDCHLYGFDADDPRDISDGNSLELEYTIPRTPDNDIQIGTPDNYKTMVADVCKQWNLQLVVLI